MESTNPVILYDGDCGLCNSSVRFITRFDKKKVFRFAPLDSDAGREIIKLIDKHELRDSVILYENNKVFQESTAVLRIARRLTYFGIAWTLILIPKVVRDFIYRLVARNRHFFYRGKDKKYQHCRL